MEFTRKSAPSGRTRYTRQNKNVILAKKTGIQILTLVGGLFSLVFKIIALILIASRWVIKHIYLTIVKYMVLPMYRGSTSIKLKSRHNYQFVQRQFGTNFSRNTILYGSIMALLLFGTASNIKARELRPEEVGRSSSLYVVLGSGNESDFVEEEASDTPASSDSIQNSKSLAQVGVQSAIKPIGDAPDDSFGTMTQTGNALIKPEITATDITPQPRDGIITYVVKEGDTISEIAETFQINTNTLLWENQIGPRDFIKPGQELVILPVSGVSHTVKRGETLNAIAARYKAKTEDILEVNHLADASELQVGKKIIIPDGIPPPPPTPIAAPSSGLANLRDIFKPAQPVAGKFNWPTASKRITQYFRGWRHTGIDIGLPLGNPIYAADDGVVITAGWNSSGYGNYIIIDHGNGIHTLYGHASKLGVKKGDRVKKGDVIGAIGSTGRSTGPHLHFEVRINGNKVNPLDYL